MPNNPSRRWFNPFGLALLLCSLLLAASAEDSSSWFVRAWLTDDGLPDNDVTGIAQNSEGYLWVATQGGLALFDGIRFREIALPIPPQRTRPLICSLLLVNGNILLLALQGGTAISRSATRTNIFTSADGLLNFRPNSLAQAHEGSIWLSYADGSACRIAAPGGNGVKLPPRHRRIEIEFTALLSLAY